MFRVLEVEGTELSGLLTVLLWVSVEVWIIRMRHTSCTRWLFSTHCRFLVVRVLESHFISCFNLFIVCKHDGKGRYEWLNVLYEGTRRVSTGTAYLWSFIWGGTPVHFVHFVTELSHYYYVTKLILRLSKSLSTTLADPPGSTSEVYACMSRCYSMPHDFFLSLRDVFWRCESDSCTKDADATLAILRQLFLVLGSLSLFCRTFRVTIWLYPESIWREKKTSFYVQIHTHWVP